MKLFNLEIIKKLKKGPALFVTLVLCGILTSAGNAEAFVPRIEATQPIVGNLLNPFFSTFATFQELYLNMVLTDLEKANGNGSGSGSPGFGKTATGNGVQKINILKYLEPPKIDWRLPDQIREEVEKKGDPIPNYSPYNELWHTVKRGETKARLDEMFKYPSETLEMLNPNVDFENLTPGERILVWKRAPYPSQSRGRANRGSLLYGEPLRPVDAFTVLYPHRVFGTTHTVALIQSVINDFGNNFPGSHPLVIGDISVRPGRHLNPHHSHQSGRDVDISYPTIIPQNNFRRFVRTRVKNLDAEKTLWLLKHFIDTGYVEYIFADRRLQRQLVKEAEKEGAPSDWISSVFQYRGKPGAIVRHARGHINHFHVRFRCTVSDPACHDSIRDHERELERLAAENSEEGSSTDQNAEEAEVELP